MPILSSPESSPEDGAKPKTMTPGEIAYNAYAAMRAGKAVDGTLLPTFDNMASDIKAAWESSAIVVRLWTTDEINALFSQRELQEIAFNIAYLVDYNHGTDGHILRTIIAKFYLAVTSGIGDVTGYAKEQPRNAEH